MSAELSTTCPNGHVSPEGSRFCNTCGTPIAGAVEANPVQPNSTAANPVQPNLDQVEVVDQQQKNFVGQVPRPAMIPQRPANSLHCSGCGHQFAKGQYVCETCNTIRPLSFDHHVDPSLFQWSLDGQAMAKLRSIKPLVAVANQVSKQVGRPWIEANFNGIRLSSRQMPHVYAMAVQAARILGLQKMPSVYVSGARPWDAMTFGSNDDAFVVMGSALVSCFQKSDLMFLFAREMGHILAGHALWKTVIQFCVGEQNAASTMMRNGVAGLLDPFKLIESAVELPLIGWARQAEITADRAGLLASGGLAQARKTMMMWSLRSPMLYRQINIAAWLEQQEEDTANSNVRLAEFVSSSTPYLTRRIKLLQEYEATAEVQQFRHKIMVAYKSQKSEAEKQAAANSLLGENTSGSEIDGDAKGSAASSEQDADTDQGIQFKCPACKKQISVPAESLVGKTALAVKCPNQECKKITRLAIPNSESTQASNEALSQM